MSRDNDHEREKGAAGFSRKRATSKWPYTSGGSLLRRLWKSSVFPDGMRGTRASYRNGGPGGGDGAEGRLLEGSLPVSC